MSVRLKVVHRTGFAYRGGARASFNEARMTPLNAGDQELRHTRLDVQPTPWTFSYTDYWGTAVTAFEVRERHDRLVVVSTSTVDVDRSPRTITGLSWDEVRSSRVQGELCETLVLSPRVEPPAELADRVRALAGGSATPGEFARAVIDLVNAEVAYVRGSTAVHSRAAQAWEARSGVCQDLAHLTVGCLRLVGVPARYVSGYLLPHTEAEVGVPVSGESHAWVEWWDGEWIGFDPTNGIAIDNHHVVVAHGRDYADVPPIVGVFTGGSTSDMFVEVEITRLR